MRPPLEGDSSVAKTPGVKGTNTAASAGGAGVWGECQQWEGVHGISHGIGAGVAGFNDGPQGAAAHGVWGESQHFEGVHGISHGQATAGVAGFNDSPQGGPGVWGEGSKNGGEGVTGISHTSGFPGVSGRNMDGGDAVFGFASKMGRGVVGVSEQHTGTEGNSTDGAGVWGSSQNGEGVHSQSNSQTGAAVAAYSLNPNGTGAAIYGESRGQGPAGFFQGNVMVTGDVVLTGADCAEDFDVCNAADVEPGTVMTLDDEGALGCCRRAYDKRVAGVIAGAGNYKPGIVLDRQGPDDRRKPVALVGKTFCRVDAGYGAVEVGDLLTTSDTPGHAMKATDPSRAFGAVIGKALCPLHSGQGLIPILVALQ